MKHGFLILTHFSPEKTSELIDTLAADNHYFFIHFDIKYKLSDEDNFYKRLLADPHVTIIKDRVDVKWGGFRIIDADINMIREALKNPEIGYLHLITGQCLPVKPNAYIDRYFEEHNGQEFMEPFLMPQTAEHGLTYQRVDKYHLHDYFNHRSKKTKDVVINKTNSILRKVQRVLKSVGIYRRYPEHFPPIYAGSAWWSLSRAACQYIIDYIDDHPAFYNRFRYTQFVDEMFFQTIIMNSPFSDKVVNNNLRYINFEGLSSSPNDIVMSDVPHFNKPDVIFARKFSDKSKEVIRYLHEQVYAPGAF